eukprot:scaffold46104_cov16-Tisochrysis_lutea.AAC.2
MQTLNGRGVAPISNTSTNLVAGRRAVQFRRPASQQQARSTVKAMAREFKCCTVLVLPSC